MVVGCAGVVLGLLRVHQLLDRDLPGAPPFPRPKNLTTKHVRQSERSEAPVQQRSQNTGVTKKSHGRTRQNPLQGAALRLQQTWRERCKEHPCACCSAAEAVRPSAPAATLLSCGQGTRFAARAQNGQLSIRKVFQILYIRLKAPIQRLHRRLSPPAPVRRYRCARHSAHMQKRQPQGRRG